MKTKCLEGGNNDTQAIMIGDYKMKFEPLSSRKTTYDHYGKRGISLHGFCLIYYQLEEISKEDGSIVNEPVKYTVYMNQILSDSNKQDALSVLGLLDAALGQIAEELPFITQIVLQMDNATSYKIGRAHV